MIFIEAPAQALTTVIPPQIMKDHCTALSMPSSGNAVGLYTTDLPGVTTGPYRQTFGFKPKGIIAMTFSGLVAVLGMMVVTWYAFEGGELDIEDVEEEVKRKMEEKRLRGTKIQRVRKLFSKSPQV
jgi:iron transport multicopper oxidase